MTPRQATNQIPRPWVSFIQKACRPRKKPPGNNTLAAISNADASRCRHVNLHRHREVRERKRRMRKRQQLTMSARCQGPHQPAYLGVFPEIPVNLEAVQRLQRDSQDHETQQRPPRELWVAQAAAALAFRRQVVTQLHVPPRCGYSLTAIGRSSRSFHKRSNGVLLERDPAGR